MIPVLDGHNDALTRADHAGFVSGRPDGHLDLPRMERGGMRGGIFAMFVASEDDAEAEPLPREDGVIEYAYSRSVELAPAAAAMTRAAGRLHRLHRDGHLQLVRTAAELDAARTDGPPAAILHIEGAECIDPGLEALEFWYAAGLRTLGPVWSRANAFGHGVPFVSPSSPDTGPGLTESGHALARRCAELGIMLDTAHLDERGFWDLARLQLGPLVASHTAAHALCPTSRNLTDAQLDEVGRTGGLVGIVYATEFLRADFADEPDTPLSLIAEHARYVADRIGSEHVGLGSDFDGATMPQALNGAANLQALLEELRTVGFSPAEIEAIAWHNWRRVLAAWWK